LESRLSDHLARSLVDGLVSGMRGRLADRKGFVDAAVWMLCRERVPAPIIAGAMHRIFARLPKIPDQKTLLEMCRAHREETRRAAAIVKKACELHANASAIIAAAAKTKLRQGELFDDLPLARNPCPRPKPAPLPKRVKPRPPVGVPGWKPYAVGGPDEEPAPTIAPLPGKGKV